jgi:hypothetical protein
MGRFARLWGGERMPHKFKIGQLVDYHPPGGLYAPRGPYLIVAQLPKREGDFEYQIKQVNAMHERIVPEADLTMAQGATAASEITEYMGYRLDARPLGKGWRVLIYPPGAKSPLSKYASNLEKGSKEAVVKEAKAIVTEHLHRTLPVRPGLKSNPAGPPVLDENECDVSRAE